MAKTRKHIRNGINLEDRMIDLAAEYDLDLPDGIEWSGRQKNSWANYNPYATIAGRHWVPVIRVSTELAADEVPGWVLDCVLVHELAHHHMRANNIAGAVHGPEFHSIANRHPRQEESLTWLNGSGTYGNDGYIHRIWARQEEARQAELARILAVNGLA